MNRRYPEDLKSLIHFDYPYWNEPNSGRKDEIGLEKWTTYMVGSGSEVLPYSSFTTPKFGYRCLKFPTNNISKYLRTSNTTGIFTLTSESNYEVECFVKRYCEIGETNNNRYVYNGHTYEFVNALKTWEEAKTACEELGGHLAVISSDDVKNFLIKLYQLNAMNADYWLGLTLNNGVKEWVTSEENNYENWYSGYPKYPTQVSYVYAGYSTCKWYETTSATTTKKYICEWDSIVPEYIPEGTTGTNDGYVFLFGATSDSNKFYVGITKYGRLTLKGNEVMTVEPFFMDDWHHVLLRIKQGIATLFVDGIEAASCEITSYPSGNKAFGIGDTTASHLCIDEFAFWHRTGEGAPIVPTEPYRPELVIDTETIYGTGSDGDAEITDDTQINSYGLITTAIDNKTFTVNSWSNGTCLPEAGREVMIHVSFTKRTSVHTTANNPAELGLYVFRKIASIDGLTVTLDEDITAENDGFVIDSTLLSSCYVQIITVPNYNSLNITSTGIIRPLTFGASTGGGIVAFRCLGNCNIAGKILTHGTGSKRYDLYQMEHSKLIDRFICSRGGGMYITCGGTFTTTEDARLGASWSGLGNGTNGAAGCGGNALNASGGVGGGAGGHGYSSRTTYTLYKGGDVSKDGEGNQSNNNYIAGGGGGLGGIGGGTGYTYAGGGGGGQAGTAGASGTNSPAYPGSAGEGPNGGAGRISPEQIRFAGGGGGAPGGDGVETCAGASLILIADRASIEEASISTGGEGYTTAGQYQYRSGAGCGFCYMAIGELIDG